MQSLLKKAAIISAIIVIYFLGIRHLRQVAVSVLMGSLLPPDYGMVNKEIEFYSQSTVSFTFTTPTSDSNGWNF